MGKKTILLVDDDPVIREIIRDALEGHYTVLEASCHSEAIKFLNHNIDLALIDYILPDSDGFETLRELRKENPVLPAIIMTAYGSESIVIKAIRSEVTDYINKPLKLSYLKLRISEIFGNKKRIIPDEYGKQERDREEFIMDGISSYIESNYMKALTIDMLASKVNMDKFRFCKVFRDKFGQTFTSYLNGLRIKNAVELLKKVDLNITEIALAVGFRNIVHFDRVFKEIHRVSPRKYRKRFNNQIDPKIS